VSIFNKFSGFEYISYLEEFLEKNPDVDHKWSVNNVLVIIPDGSLFLLQSWMTSCYFSFLVQTALYCTASPYGKLIMCFPELLSFNGVLFEVGNPKIPGDLVWRPAGLGNEWAGRDHEQVKLGF
jgi:hypothetical protein